MAGSTENYSLDLFQVKIQASLPHSYLTEIAAFSPKVVYPAEQVTLKQEKNKTWNVSLQVSASPVAQMGIENGSSNGTKQIQNLWEIRAFPQEESNGAHYSRLVRWKYIHNSNLNSVKIANLVERPTFLLGYAKRKFYLPVLKVEIIIFWSASMQKSSRWKRKCPANFNFLHYASLEVDLQPLSEAVNAFKKAGLKHTVPKEFVFAGGYKEYPPYQLDIPDSTLEISINEAIEGRIEGSDKYSGEFDGTSYGVWEC